MPIKAVFFDAAGTLMRPARRVGESYVQIAAKYGKDVPAAAVAERFRACFNTAPPLAFPGAGAAEIDLLERNWWKELVRRVFEPWGEFERFDEYFSELFSHFARPAAWILYPEVPQTLAALKQRGLLLAVISNFDSRLLKILDGLGARQWFDEVFISSRVGHAKPHRKIFEAALLRYGLTPERALHVGDSESNDLLGARNAGVKGLLVDRDRGAETDGGPIIRSLNEILSHLDG